MKFLGSLALGSSSALKYFSTCVSCFQKLSVSYVQISACRSLCPAPAARPAIGTPLCWLPYLKLLVTVEQQHVYRLNLRHVSMPLKLLPYLGSDLGNRHVQGVHLLNLWGLYGLRQRPCILMPFPAAVPSQALRILALSCCLNTHTARSQSL